MSALSELHRDPQGRALLVGPDCPDCGRRVALVYGCSRCLDRWEVPGRMEWVWQGKSHRHRPDDEQAWHRTVVEHVNSHHGNAMLLATPPQPSETLAP